jgi:FixJ family two-component response regulator
MRGSPVVAIIDDDGCVREAAAHLIASEGYRTEVYTSAKDFIDQVMESEASCLLSDVHMKELSGVELARHLSWLGLVLPVLRAMCRSAHANLRPLWELCVTHGQFLLPMRTSLEACRR